jgi:hypothetical protein
MKRKGVKSRMKHRKLWSFVIALAFLFSAMGMAFAPSSAVAANPGDYLSGDAIPPTSDADCSTYLIGEPTTDAISVTLVMEAANAYDYMADVKPGTAFRKELQVSLTGAGGKTISSVLIAADAAPANGLAFFDEHGAAFGPTSKELKKVVLSGSYSATWQAGFVGFDGWEYRINDKFPVQLTSNGLGYEGPYPYDTPVYNGDVVHFFFEFPSDLDEEYAHLEANYVRAVYKGFNNTTKKLTAQLQGHKVYIEPISPYIMSVYNYVNLGSGMIASLYDATGTTLIQRGQPSDLNGVVTFTDNSLVPGTYVIKTVPAYYYDNDEEWFYGGDAPYFTLTGAYSFVTIP